MKAKPTLVDALRWANENRAKDFVVVGLGKLWIDEVGNFQIFNGGYWGGFDKWKELLSPHAEFIIPGWDEPEEGLPEEILEKIDNYLDGPIGQRRLHLKEIIAATIKHCKGKV